MDDHETKQYLDSHSSVPAKKTNSIKHIGYETDDAAEMHLPATGNNKILTVLIEFPDQQFTSNLAPNQTIKQVVQTNLNTNSRDVKNYFTEASFGKQNLNFTVVGPYMAPENFDYYAEDDTESNESDVNIDELVRFAIREAASEVDMSQYDNDNDGDVDFVHILFAYNHRGISPNNNILHQNGKISSILRDGKWCSTYTISEIWHEIPNFSNTFYAHESCHLLCHMMGAPDFGDNISVDNDGSGHYDILSNLYYPLALPNPYVRANIFGWSRIVEVNNNNTKYTLYPANMQNNPAAEIVYKISTDTEGEYFLLENRQALGFEENTCNGERSGLIVWHVHKDIDNSQYNNTLGMNKLYYIHANGNNTERYGGVYTSEEIDSHPFPGTSKNYYLSGTTTPALRTWDGKAVNKSICSIREVPYGETNIIEFIYNQEILGSNTICDLETYTLVNAHNNAYIHWSYKGYSAYNSPHPFEVVSGQGTGVATYQIGEMIENITDPTTPGTLRPKISNVNYVPFMGEKDISATVSYGDRKFTFFKTIATADIEDPEIKTYMYFGDWKVGQTRTFYVDNLNIASNKISWKVDYPDASFPTASIAQYGESINITAREAGTINITATRLDSCPNTATTTVSYTIKNSTPPVIPFFTNPINGSNVDISVVQHTVPNANGAVYAYATSQTTEEYMGAYRLELWHEIYGMVRTIDAEENTPNINMNLNGLANGTYLLRLIIDGEVVNVTQMIIE